ncbi:uncharacterized protein LOC135692835 [Rhopilema esculentum]|uniref:uncharacterized protein LOC135692835 n=1 Tax=Rhopilema esculentum TaxID=499914 RepID=UPI0031DA2AB6
MYSLKHMASFPGILKKEKAIETLNRIKDEEGLLPYPLLLDLSDEVLIVSDEHTKKILEAYRMKKISKCKLTDGGKEIGNVLLLSTSKSNGKILATHIFKASDELLEMASEEINYMLQRQGKMNILRRWKK